MYGSTLCVNGQVVTWQREYPRLFNVYGTYITQINDGGYVSCGETKVSPRSIFVIRVNYLGDTLWSNLFEGVVPFKIIQTIDNNIVIIGFAEGKNGFSSDGFIMKIDLKKGIIIWNRKYGGKFGDVLTDILELNSGQLFLWGSSEFSANLSKGFLLKTNCNGDSVSIKYFDDTKGLGEICQYTDNRYLLTGSKSIITDTSGNLIRVSGNPTLNLGICDSVGDSFFFIKDTLEGKIRVIKTDTMFNQILVEIIEIPDRNLKIFDIIKSKNSILICGYSTIPSIGIPSGFVLELNFNIKVKWFKDYKITDNFSLFFSLNNCYDNGYIIVGQLSPLLKGDISNILITKTDSLGNTIYVNILNSNQTMMDFNLFQNYPNPFNPKTKISFSIPKGSFVTLKVFDITGREVKTLINEYKQSGSYETEFDASLSARQGNAMSSGVYYYKLETGDNSEIKKMILVK